MQITLEQASFAYGTRRPGAAWALRAVSLTLEPGEFVALAGRSGSGKSTLVQLLKGLLLPVSGHVLVDGVDPVAARRPELFDQVGLVFQYPEHQLFAGTVGEDVAFGPRQQLRGTRGRRPGAGSDESWIRAQVEWALAAVGIDLRVWADRHPLELSGGEKRRVAIAGVLALRPRLLILDEPTAGLDARGRRSLFDLLHRLNREEGVTVLMVSHRPEEMLAHASRLLVLDGGALVGDGSPRQLLSDEAFAHACGLERPDCLCLTERLAAAGAPALERPWEPAALAAQVLAWQGTER